jgi:hypothetical protein
MWATGPASLKPTTMQNQYALSPTLSSSSSHKGSLSDNKNKTDAIPASPTQHNNKSLDFENDASSESPFSIVSIEFKSPRRIRSIAAVAAVEEDYATSLFDAENLLADIRRARAEQRSCETQLVKNIHEQLQQAMLEQMEGCHDEAETCKMQANRLKQERELVASAITVLDMHILGMEAILEDAQLIRAAVVDCSEHQLFAQELKDQLRR